MSTDRDRAAGGPSSPVVAVDPDSAVAPDDVWDRLDRVDDPELDRSIVDLEYVDRIEIDADQSSGDRRPGEQSGDRRGDDRTRSGGDAVHVAFVLPTAWCSPAFAWMMATGIRDEVGDLDGVASVRVELRDHMHGEEITTGVNGERTFQETFPEAEDGIEAVRRTLDEKARLARQHAACESLLSAGVSPDQIADLRRSQVDLTFGDDRVAVSLADGDVMVTADREPLAHYLEKARAIDLVAGDDDRLFADPDCDPIDPDEFELVHDRARAAKVNVAGQGSVCEGLHESRNGVAPRD